MTKKVKTRLPKSVAGVKIPKTVRKGDWFEGLLNSEIGRKVLADALLAAANAAVGVLAGQNPKVKKIARAAEEAVKVVAFGLVEEAPPKNKPKSKARSKKAAEKASEPKKAAKRASKKASAQA